MTELRCIKCGKIPRYRDESGMPYWHCKEHALQEMGITSLTKGENKK